MIRRIAVLTAGGDCPGLNAVIRAVVKTAINKYGMTVLGIKDGYRGLVENDTIELTNESVRGILPQGGTILGSSNKENPLKYLVNKQTFEYRDMSDVAIRNMREHGVEAMVIIGGDGTLASAQAFQDKGMPTVGVPKTIDNDLVGTDTTFGFNTAVTVATEAIDRLRTTANAHKRVMVVEVMGRDAGWIALNAGVAGGASIILIPEIPYDLDKVCEKLEQRKKDGYRETIIVVAEGAKPINGEVVVARIVEDSHEKIRLGGIANKLADDIEKKTGFETRATILGHVQRGGSPTVYDRVLGTRYGEMAVELIAEEKFGYMVSLKGTYISHVPLSEVVGHSRKVYTHNSLVKAAKGIGICFGD